MWIVAPRQKAAADANLFDAQARNKAILQIQLLSACIRQIRYRHAAPDAARFHGCEAYSAVPCTQSARDQQYPLSISVLQQRLVTNRMRFNF